MKKLFYLFILLPALVFIPQAQAENVIPSPQPVLMPETGRADLSRTYKIPPENLFYLFLSALNDCSYSIEEIQFKAGCILFKAYTKEFIASIASQDASNTFIKISPADSSYNFSPLLIQKLHKYIELNNNINFKKVL